MVKIEEVSMISVSNYDGEVMYGYGCGNTCGYQCGMQCDGDGSYRPKKNEFIIEGFGCL